MMYQEEAFIMEDEEAERGTSTISDELADHDAEVQSHSSRHPTMSSLEEEDSDRHRNAVIPTPVFIEDGDDPRHKTYKPFVAKACLVCFLLFACQMVSALSVLPDTMITWFNGGISCNGEATRDDPACKSANAKYIWMSGISASVGCFLTFLGSPLLGVLSDSYGRRKPIIFCATTVVIQQFGLMAYVLWDASLYLYLGLGVLASFDATSVLLAYLSDSVPPSKRAWCFGLLFASATAAIVIGPFVGQSVSVATCFTIGFWTSVCYLFCCLFLLPESLDYRLRTKFALRDWNPFRSMAVLGRYTMFQRLAAVVFVGNFIERGKFAVNYSFLKARFGITESFFSYVALVFGVLGLFTQSVVLKYLVKRISNQKIMMIGLTASMLNMVAYSFIWYSWQVFPVELFACFSFISFPAISAMKSMNTDPREQGKIQGALFGVRQLGGGLGPIVFGYVLAQTTTDGAPYYNPELIWYIASVVAFIAILLGLSVPAVITREETKLYQAEQAKQLTADQLTNESYMMDAGLDSSDPEPTGNPYEPMQPSTVLASMVAQQQSLVTTEPTTTQPPSQYPSLYPPPLRYQYHQPPLTPAVHESHPTTTPLTTTTGPRPDYTQMLLQRGESL